MLGARAVGGAALADFVDGCIEPVRGHAGIGQRLRRRGALFDRKREQQAFDGDETVARLLGGLLGGGEYLGERLGQINLPVASGNFRNFREHGLIGKTRLGGVAAGARNQ